MQNAFHTTRWHQYCKLLSLYADMLDTDTPNYDSKEVVLAKKLYREAEQVI